LRGRRIHTRHPVFMRIKGGRALNRPYVYRGHKVPGVYQRCTSKCGSDKCDRHKWQYEVELSRPDGGRDRAVKGGFATAKEALEARAEVLRQHKLGARSLDPKM